jgi:O-acetyl-ADP-ribose deacetylase (regulator of RNase III)
MVKYVKGNLLDSNCDYICHQVNCQGVMGSGIAKQIRERWPEVYDIYRELCDTYQSGDLIGGIQVAGHVVNIFSQDNFGYDGRRYTSYDAFVEALLKFRTTIPSGSTIGFPKNIGCGLGGGNWKIISTMIEEILGGYYDVYIYELED